MRLVKIKLLLFIIKRQISLKLEFRVVSQSESSNFISESEPNSILVQQLVVVRDFPTSLPLALNPHSIPTENVVKRD
jgi:hypothetical protein